MSVYHYHPRHSILKIYAVDLTILVKLQINSLKNMPSMYRKIGSEVRGWSFLCEGLWDGRGAIRFGWHLWRFGACGHGRVASSHAVTTLWNQKHYNIIHVIQFNNKRLRCLCNSLTLHCIHMQLMRYEISIHDRTSFPEVQF